MENTKLKIALKEEINNFVGSINELDKINVDLYHVSDEKAEYIKQKYENDIERFNKVLREIKKKAESLTKSLRSMDNLEWNTLTLAFFGETNAGKSTLIEAITCGDGKTIGDGRKDFTRSVKTYELGKNINILDMPGIEGDESKVKKEIWKAVQKAHMIFYVCPDNKEPERETLEKIKKYLRKNSEVYTILNIRGVFPPRVFEEKLNTTDEIIRKRTDNHIKNILGETYRGSFLVHALFAFFARGRKVPQNLKGKYNTALKLYGDIDTLLRYSNIESLLNFIDKSVDNYNTRILWGNFRKVLSTQEEIIGKLLNWKAKFDRNLKEIREEVENLKRKFEREKKILEKNIERIIQVETENLKNKLISELYEAIDNEYSKSYMEEIINKVAQDSQNTLKDRLNNEVEDFKDKVVKDLEILHEKIDFMTKFKVDIDIQSAFKELEYSFKEIFQEIVDVVISIISIFKAFSLNPILGIVSAVINIVRKIWDWVYEKPKDKKTKAKRKAREKAKEMAREIRWEMKRKLEDTYREINKQFRNAISKIESINRSLIYLSRSLNPVIAELIKSNARTSLLFINAIDPDAEFAYIQTSLNEGTHVAVVTPNREKLISELGYLGIEEENIYVYTQLYDLIEDLDFEEGEFFKRLSKVIGQSV